jgi:hypothetical protein
MNSSSSVFVRYVQFRFQTEMKLSELAANLEKPIYPLSEMKEIAMNISSALFRGRPALLSTNSRDIAKLAVLPRNKYVCNMIAYDNNVVIVEHFDRTLEEHVRSLAESKEELVKLMKGVAHAILFLQEHNIPLFEISESTMFVSSRGEPKISPLWIKATVASRARVKQIDRNSTISSLDQLADQKANVFNFGRMVYKCLYRIDYDGDVVPEDDMTDLLKLMLHKNSEQRPTFRSVMIKLSSQKTTDAYSEFTPKKFLCHTTLANLRRDETPESIRGARADVTAIIEQFRKTRDAAHINSIANSLSKFVSAEQSMLIRKGASASSVESHYRTPARTAKGSAFRTGSHNVSRTRHRCISTHRTARSE